MLSTRLTVVSFLAAAWCWTSEGHLYDVICPGVKGELKCPEGQVIEVHSVHCGVKIPAICAARNQSAKVSDKDCMNKAMLDWIKLVCYSVESCELPEPDPKMFVCDYSPDTFIQVSYTCKPKTFGVHSTVICEGQSVVLKCEKGVLNVMKAIFGRVDETTCTHTPLIRTFCASAEAGQRVKFWCDKKKVCTITALRDYLGDPSFCDNIPLYLTMDYVCE